MLLSKPTIFNGYGIKRWDYHSFSVGFSNKVYIHSYPVDGVWVFAYSNVRFPFRFFIQFGKVTQKVKRGLYFGGSIKEPYTSFKVVLFGHLFIGGNSPEWLKKWKRRKDEAEWEKAAEAFEQYLDYRDSRYALQEEYERSVA